MRWIGGRESENVVDRRGIGGVQAGIGGIGAIVVVLLGMFFGIRGNPMTVAPAPRACRKTGAMTRCGNSYPSSSPIPRMCGSKS
ncbi:MAG: neutral zinc metallopeptidase, partial [Stellaceae bacterium]